MRKNSSIKKYSIRRTSMIPNVIQRSLSHGQFDTLAEQGIPN